MSQYVTTFLLIFIAVIVAVGLVGTFTTGKGKLHFGIPDQ